MQDRRRVARGEHARDGRRPAVLEGRGRVLRHAGLGRPELGIGVVQAGVHLGQPGLGGGQLLAGLVELHADPVELRGELVDLALNLAHGRLRRRAGDPAVDGQPAHHGQPGRDGGGPPHLEGSRAQFVHVAVVLPLHVRDHASDGSSGASTGSRKYHGTITDGASAPGGPPRRARAGRGRSRRNHGPFGKEEIF